MVATVQRNLTAVLAEIKTLQKRIEKSIKEVELISIGYAHPTSISKKDQDTRAERIRSLYQKITDMISRRALLKAILVETNAKHTITVGGKTMSIASAIEKKTSIKFEKDLLTQMCLQKKKADEKLEISNRQMETELDAIRRSCVANSSSQPMSPSDIQNQVEARKKEVEKVLINPLNLDTLIEVWRDDISKFEEEIDVALSTYDATTIVDVPM